MRLLSCLALSLLWLVAGPACSYAFVRGPSPVVEQASRVPAIEQKGLECTSSNAIPIVDTLLSAPLIGVGALGIVAGAETGWGEAITLGAAVTALGILALTSAVTGYGRTADCRAQQAVPALPRQSDRYLLDLDGIADARGRKGQERH